MVQVAGRSEQTKHRLFPENSGHDGNTDIHMAVFCPYPEMAVLGDSLFRNVQVRHNFNTGNQRLVHIPLQGDIFQDDAVNSHPDLCFPVKRLYMNIAGIAFDGPFHQAVKQVDNGSLFVYIFQLCQVKIIQFIRHKSGIGLSGRLPGTHFRKIVGNGLPQGFFLAKQNLQIAACLLSHLFQSKIIQGVIGHQKHGTVFYT